ncbi:hypothetical protein LTS17_000657 [Exophiala oligosperma]
MAPALTKRSIKDTVVPKKDTLGLSEPALKRLNRSQAGTNLSADQQKAELALLIAERGTVSSRDQDLSPQQQREIEENYGEVEVYVNQPLLDLVESDTGVPGVIIIRPALQATEITPSYRKTRWCMPLVWKCPTNRVEGPVGGKSNE